MAMTADQNDLFSWIDEARRTAGADRTLEELVDRLKRDKVPLLQ